MLPGDVVLLRLAGEGGRVAEDVLRAERTRLGLDQALWRQYVDWIWGLGRGDLGLSMWTGRPVAQEIRIRLGLSLELTILATALAVAVAIPLGILAALHRATWLDYVLRVFTLVRAVHAVLLGRRDDRPAPASSCSAGARRSPSRPSGRTRSRT